MKNLLKVLLLTIALISNVGCSRRVPNHSGSRRGVHNTEQTSTNSSENSGNTSVNIVSQRVVEKTKPNVEQIKRDLVGHSLSEGIKDGYYPSYWKWTIREGEVSNFSVEQVIVDSSIEYEILCNMRLSSSAGKAFDAKARICYVFNDTEGWHIQFVQSQGMYIVKTGKYSDCIKIEKGRDYSDFINQCDISLEVGGIYYGWPTPAQKEWMKFSKVIEPHQKYRMRYDYRIDYVEVP